MTVDVNALLTRGLAAWPGLVLGQDDFAAYLADKGPVDEAHAADLVLASACALGVAKALDYLEQHYLSRAGSFLARIDTDPSFVDEVTQRARERLLVASAGTSPQISRYAGRGALGAWLRIAMVRVALDLKNVRSVAQPEADESLIADDPELMLLRERYLPAFGEAVRAATRELDVRTRTILRMHYVDRASIDAIGTSYRVSRATAARWIVAGREALVAKVYERLGAELATSPSELESLIRVVRSDVEISLSTLFG